MTEDVRLLAALVVLVAVACGALAAARVPLPAAVLRAAGRAAVQLAVLALVLRAVFTLPLAAGAVLVVMLTVASATAVGRLRELPGARRAVPLAVLAGVVPTLAVVFATGAAHLEPRYLLALGGIVTGGTMTACVLTGRHLLSGLRSRRDEVEGWLALGAPPRRATADVVRAAVGESLLPALDQTRTVGLVTLPGAFIGALFGGASPADAARFQLLVLVSLLCAEALAASALGRLLGAPRQLPG